MKFSMSSSAMSQAIQNVIGIVPSRSTIPVLSNLLLTTEDGKIKVVATDLDITLISWANASIEEEGETTVPAKILNEVIRELPETNIQVTVTEDNHITLITPSGEFNIAGESKEDFPSLPVLDVQEKLSVPAAMLKRMIEKTIFACSNDELRPALTGAFLTVADNNLEMVTTDGHRLVRIIEKNIETDIAKSVIIPTRALNFLLKGLGGSNDQIVVFGENHILFELPDFKIYSRLIKENYPDYERVIPKDNTKEAIVPRNEFLSAARRVSLFASQITNQMRVQIEPEKLTVMAEDVDFGGQGKESVPASFNSDLFEIGYNAIYLMDILRHLDTKEVRLLLETSTKAGLIMPTEQEENEDLLMLLMPVRLNN
jgi:DNA polymerase-3 subunit beta